MGPSNLRARIERRTATKHLCSCSFVVRRRVLQAPHYTRLLDLQRTIGQSYYNTLHCSKMLSDLPHSFVVRSTTATGQSALLAHKPEDASLCEYICQGPLLSTCGLSTAKVLQEFSAWITLGKRLAEQLGFDYENLDSIQRLRIFHYYLPVFFWVQQQLEGHKRKYPNEQAPALVVGISAPQGCGKTTLVEQLEALFNWLGNRAASVSIDDFYLTYQDQTALASANPDNSLLRYRGNAGTHDLELGTSALKTLRSLLQPSQTAAVPRYNKSAYGGRGDRAESSSWPTVSGPLEVVLFEGWMLGFRPTDEASVVAVDPSLKVVNEKLAEYQAAWDSYVDSWLVVRVGEPQWVYKWRLQAEEKMKAEGKAGMTDQQIADFVSRFIPAYQAYLPGLYSHGPTTAAAGHTLIIQVDENRSPIAKQPAPVV